MLLYDDMDIAEESTDDIDDKEPDLISGGGGSNQGQQVSIRKSVTPPILFAVTMRHDTYFESYLPTGDSFLPSQSQFSELFVPNEMLMRFCAHTNAYARNTQCTPWIRDLSLCQICECIRRGAHLFGGQLVVDYAG
ncbi:hypothetical protein EON65_32295 [archaeon]|nr:MAG: hypothetical protein EON65_32295 [archaeon]